MQLKLNEETIHISHYMNLVSAYHPSPERIQDLIETIESAIKIAKENTQSLIVDQDSPDFFFVVHPSGHISLCATMKTFTPILSTTDSK